MPLMERDYKGPRNYRDGGIQNMCVQSFRKAQKAHDPDDCERWEEDDKIDTLSAHGTTSASAILQTVPRRLTPVECERLQGFPDDWTQVEYKGKPMADGPRYRMMGNAVTTTVAEWIGRRILAVENGDE